MEHLNMTKEELRKEMLKKRRDLDQDFIRSAGTKALDLLRGLDRYLRADTVMLYMDYRNEFPTGPILADLLRRGKRPVLPLTDAEFRMTPYALREPQDQVGEPDRTGPQIQDPLQIQIPEAAKKEDSFESPSVPYPSFKAPCFASLESRLCLSPMGIPEPDPRRCRQTDPAEIDLVIVPGVVFDRSGNRIGFGKACYDRFLPMLRPGVPKIGLAYEFQVLPQIPTEPTDIRMNFIVTETALRTIR